ncbi:MAG: baseplate J/gp47 family protein [Vogesella sp.]|uniref:baseplate assembly protein n=1 Tax=Vogesella sp. TaxID=1904252 RepID=UPI00391B28F2
MIELSRLPAPKFVDVIDFETLFAEKKARLLAAAPADMRASLAATLQLESEPLTIALQEDAYSEMLLRQRVNEAGLANLLAYAEKSDLDQIGANYGVQRLQITPENPDSTPPTTAVYEQDTPYRQRIQESWARLSCAGPIDSYKWHAKSASGLVKDAGAISFTPGCVTVFVLSSEGNGTASAELISAVDAALNDQAIRPLTDAVTVQSAAIIPYAITAELIVYPGPDATVVTQAALAAAKAYADAQHRLDRDVVLSGIYATLHQPGVQRVILHSPAADIIVSAGQAAYCTDITVTQGGIGV